MAMENPEAYEMDDRLVELMAFSLCQENLELFSSLKTDLENVRPNVRSEAELIFQRLFEGYSFETFHNQWMAMLKANAEQQDDDGRQARIEDEGDEDTSIPGEAYSSGGESSSTLCGRRIFDPHANRYAPRPWVVPVERSKKRKAEFNTYHFILSKREKQDYFPLDMTMDYDVYLRDVDVEAQSQARAIADESIRKAGTVGLMLNKSCKFRVVEVVTQKSVV